MLVVVLLFLAFLLAAPAQAGDWKPYKISDHLRGIVGVGAEVEGVLEDRLGSRAVEISVAC